MTMVTVTLMKMAVMTMVTIILFWCCPPAGRESSSRVSGVHTKSNVHTKQRRSGHVTLLNLLVLVVKKYNKKCQIKFSIY